MKQKEIIDLIKIIDRCYKTDYAGDKEVVNDWFKVLKNYELGDMMNSLDNYMKNYTNYPPKVYDLIRGYQTIDAKKILDHANTRCMFCNKVLQFGKEEKHIDRCRSVEFIKSAVGRFKNQEIDVEKYRKMGDEEFEKYYMSAVKLVVNNTNNELEKKMWQKYLEIKE